MHKRLRWQLTLLYLLAGLGLAAVLGAGSYSLLRNTLEQTTDLAIQYKMANSFASYGLDTPDALEQARRTWLQTYAVEFSSSSGEGRLDDEQSEPEEDGDEHGEEGDDEEDHGDEPEEFHEEELYDARLAALFVFPLGPDGKLLENPNSNPPLISPDPSAAQAAAFAGSDWRTVTLPGGARVRLLTYRTGSQTGPALIQVGRLLDDQDRALNQFLASLALLSGATILLLGVLSWLLSGRSLGPAQKAWDQQQVFVANASHELRTPLTLIRASAEYGLMNDPGPEIRPLLEDIRNETDYMNRLVEDLLLLSRLDARRLELGRERIRVQELVSEVSASLQRMAAERDIHLVAGGVEGVILGDPVRIRQVLLILLDNAFRFTEPGGTIAIDSQVQKQRVVLRVIDNGCGIAPQDLPHVFDRFYQAANAVKESAHSNGLGLSIAKALVEAQGGMIGLESQVGKGTRASLSFPAAA